MITKALTIALAYLQTITRNRSFLFQMIVIPLLLTFIIGQAIGGGADELPDPNTKWRMVIANEDTGSLATQLVEYLQSTPRLEVQLVDRAAANAAVASADTGVIGALIIPADFSTKFASDQAVTLDYASFVASVESQYLEQSVDTALGQLSHSLNAADVSADVADELGLFATSDNPTTAQQTYRDDAVERALTAWETNPPVVVEAEQASFQQSDDGVPRGLNQTSPGLLVMFAFFFTIGGGSSLIQERTIGTLQRLMVMPMRKSTILFGKLLGIYIGCLIQIGILVLAGAFLFNVDWGNSPIAMLVFIPVFALNATSLSIMLAALVQTDAQLNSVSTIVVMALAALGGAWWPIEIVPEWMQQLGHALPSAWAMDGFNDIITRGLGLEAVLFEIGVLMAFTVGFFIIGIWRFRYE
ncbi:MAG TPA: ABC transporter permease [Herpetosiphon sp.]|uniref:ABC-2 type transporter n=1 Tax=Herpetosiphon aurantiacus (strain ATCC 23779 / DSM 785 / 114-95) TaxID=316274 RepID=A9AUK5_HERA2|nr:ABC transporter permease [Herpetosiphon sp.]ABX04532.1 ABC-2 type transporter [Herpetosiphon aurantiacus DSM 785]HBW50003.1 ABC transporter permease [Herpetosiphon sp.]